MATRVLKELSVVVSSYDDRNTGQTKNRYENIGALLESTNERGETNTFLMIKRSFNPAGIAFKPGSDKIMVSMFDPRPREGSGQQSHRSDDSSSYGGSAYGASTGGASRELDDEIPFLCDRRL